MTDILNLIVVVSVALERNNRAAEDLREQLLKPCSERYLIKQKAYCSEFCGNEYRCDQDFILWQMKRERIHLSLCLEGVLDRGGETTSYVVAVHHAWQAHKLCGMRD